MFLFLPNSVFMILDGIQLSLFSNSVVQEKTVTSPKERGNFTFMFNYLNCETAFFNTIVKKYPF
jgi:hypothetical protein